MKPFLIFAVCAAAVTTVPYPVYGQEATLFDRSCNALQHVQQENRLRSMENAGVVGAEQYRQALMQFRVEMDTLFEKSSKLEQQFNTRRNQQIEALINARQDLVDRYRDVYALQHPDLVSRIQQGDQRADQEFRSAVLQQLLQDTEFSRLLRTRMEQDEEGNRLRVEAFKLQLGEFHDIESRQAKNRMLAPPDPSAQAVLAKQTREFVSRQGYQLALQQALIQNRALGDLMTVMAAAQRGSQGALEDRHLDGAAAELRSKFDSPVANEQVALPNVSPVLGTPVTRETLRELEAARLRSQLDFSHITQQVLPAAGERREAMRDTSRPLTAPTAEATGIALQRYTTTVRNGYERLNRYQSPPPPSMPSSGEIPASKLAKWAEKSAASLENAAKKVKYILLDDKP